MPLIRNIEFFFPEDGQANSIFYSETRCIASLYSRLLPNFKTDEFKGIMINCVSSFDILDKLDSGLFITFDYKSVITEIDMREFLSLPTDQRKKEYTLKMMQKPLEQVAEELNWDISIFKDIYQKIIALNFENKWVYSNKRSPNRKYSSSIVCEQEVSYIDVYFEIKNRNGEVLGRERIMREPHTDEQHLLNKLGKIEWTHNHKVTFSDLDYKTIYIITFIEKDTPEKLFWKYEQLII
ncbi:hypothetical protein JOC86_000231 [Bacillus pakistanensis]|uniref:Uncharacterized protein n=1 Tax=Rossellomorea pakistanensis TaxID=992288 RepID=A0ABS2N797_9BACI|nr:hypothetical protein [Bacillus pakistanensis]MBM7583694.1 hypothetical protein [Bacillus pakistanensis]